MLFRSRTPLYISPHPRVAPPQYVPHSPNMLHTHTDVCPLFMVLIKNRAHALTPLLLSSLPVKSHVAQDSPASVHSAGILKQGTGGVVTERNRDCMSQVNAHVHTFVQMTDVSVQCSHVAQDSPVSVHGAHTLKGMGLSSSDHDRTSQVSTHVHTFNWSPSRCPHLPNSGGPTPDMADPPYDSW